MEELPRLALFMAGQVGKYLFLLFSVCLWMHTCLGSTDMGTTIGGDGLKPGDILNHSTQLCSKSRIFCMGFDKTDDRSDITYLMIYDNNRNGYVWIGNRDEPIVKKSGMLILDQNGSLKIIPKGDAGKPIKVLYFPSQPLNNTVATLLDTGKLVLQQLHPNGSTMSVLWQSFDYPTSVLIPGMKLGVNHKTGHSWSLVSQITADNPASGVYALEWESKNAELIILARGSIYWKSGSYRNNKPFQNIPEVFRGLYQFTVVSNEEEDSFAFTSRYKSDEDTSYWVLSYRGVVYERRSATEDVARADRCDGFNEDGGCQKLKNMSACWSPSVKLVRPQQGFFNFADNPNRKYFRNDTNPRLTKVDCWQRCWSNCDFVGFCTIYDIGTGCTFLLINALDLIDYNIPSDYDQSTGAIFSVLKEKELLHHQREKKWIWRSIVIGTFLLIICLFILCLTLRKRKIILEARRKSTQAMVLDLQTSNESTSATYLQEEKNKGHDLRIFSYESIIEATNDFSLENKLGQGGFGPVYKGILPTSQEIAIKRLSTTSRQGIVEFKNELALICELQHINLVQLLGCCIYKEDKMLIYEYMPNKSLDFFLFDPTRSRLLDWEKRFNIVEGIAQGLLYLHKYSRLKVIHRDLKASNILLDEDMNPKISDFGMARMFTQQEYSEINTRRIVGTFGYMSPEYAMDGVYSTKSDVYSFGVLLLEIVTGKRINSFHNANHDGPLNLVGYAWDQWKKGAALQLIDPSLEGFYVHEEVLKCIHISILCVEENAHDRPTMSNIISILTDKRATLPLPKRPAILHIQRNAFEGKTSSKESNITSACETSFCQSNSG